MAGSDKSYWIFTISNDGLRKLLDTDDAVTILYDQEGNQLYPFEEVLLETKDQVEVMELSQSGRDTGDGYSRMYSSMDVENLQLVRIIRSDYLFLELNQFRTAFLLVVMLMLILGGILVATLSFYNNRPINELEIFCENKFGDIPENIKGLDIFRFTLDKMEEKVTLLEQKQKAERLLLQMIYGKNCNTNYFRDMMIKSGLFMDAERYRVIYVYPNDDVISSFNLPVYFEMLLDKEYELHMMEYAKQNVIIGIIGMKEENELQLKDRLNAITVKICELNTIGIHICVGGSCDKIEEIHWSYMQALMISHKSKKQENSSVSYFEENANMKMRFIYPKLELDALYDALIAANFNKASLINDVLVDTIREQSYNRFVCTTLCYDVINAYYRAQTKLEFQNKDSKPKVDSKLIYGITDIEEIISIILQVREQSRAYMEKGSQDVQPKDIATKVIAFIDQNSKDRNLCVSMVADTFQMSISNLSHQFKALTNMNISDYITDKKFIYVRELLLDTDYSVQKIADMMGYNQTTSFIRKFKQYYGMTPSEYRVFYQKEQPRTMISQEQV
jgi:AraC-like DNA-binding protein